MYRLMCLKCGNTQTPYDGNKGYCIVCNCKMEQIPDGYGFSDEEIETFFSSGNVDFDEYWKQNEKRLFDEIISKSPKFDINLYTKRDLILKQNEQQQEEAIIHGRTVINEQSNIPKCPTCSSTNIKRISITSKVTSVALFGLLSTKRSKTFHCNNCGYEW